MDDSTSTMRKLVNRKPFGMSSFGHEERQQFGQNLRIAMACIDGSAEPVKNTNTDSLPLDAANIRQRLMSLSRNMSSYHADLLELLVRFDDLGGYKSSGASHCAAWINSEIGISLKLGWEYLRVGRKLRLLPTTMALFRAGSLSWSKIRLLVTVADQENENILCHAALDASVSQVVQLCKGYRWHNVDSKDGEDDADNAQAIRQWDSRSLTWDEASNGSTCIRLVLPPETARAFLNSVEHSLNQLDVSEDKYTQRRADAAVLMAESSLQAAGREVATADRYQVIVAVDASELASAKPDNQDISNNIPAKRPSVRGAGSIARETARRIACDCSVTTNTISNGEPTNIGRKSRLWPPAMARAIKARDQHCQFYGCTQSHNLQIHHIKHWADGGTTCVSNGACLCQYHHTMVHEGGYAVEKVDGNEHRLNQQFVHQQVLGDVSLETVEHALRNDKDSFKTVRRLSPTRYRFRIVDRTGHDIRNRPMVNATNNYDNNANISTSQYSSIQRSAQSGSTRVECAEQAPPIYKSWMYGMRPQCEASRLVKLAV